MKEQAFCCAVLAFLGVAVITHKVPAQEVSVTVYNRNLGLVRDVRDIAVKKGEQVIQLQDVAAQIDPTSVHLRSLTDAGSFTVLEQNFEYDIVSSQKILQKYIDHEIELYTSLQDTLTGKLLSSGNALILALKNGEIRLLQMRDVRGINFPRLPQGLITRPTLVWLVRSPRKATHRIETEYLTTGLTWHAEYVAILNDRETAIDLTAWVSVENNSGVAYRNARLKLVAGAVHLVEGRRKPTYPMARAMRMEAEQPVQEKEFFEYHLYTIQRRTTLNNNQVKQITFFDAAGVKVKKKFVFDGKKWPDQVRIYTRFKNEEDNHLGIPMPAGRFRVYKKHSDGSMIFLGEDQIDHTPKDEWLETYLGNAFDIHAERKQMYSRKTGSNRLEQSFAITIRNHKKESVTVVVIEHLQYRMPESEWHIRESTFPFRKKDGRTVEFTLTVAPDQEARLVYIVDYSW